VERGKDEEEGTTKTRRTPRKEERMKKHPRKSDGRSGNSYLFLRVLRVLVVLSFFATATSAFPDF
jgi:hypothetical protein